MLLTAHDWLCRGAGRLLESFHAGLQSFMSCILFLHAPWFLTSVGRKIGFLKMTRLYGYLVLYIPVGGSPLYAGSV